MCHWPGNRASFATRIGLPLGWKDGKARNNEVVVERESFANAASRHHGKLTASVNEKS